MMNGLSILLQRIPYLAPWLIVQVAGILLAIRFFNRYRLPSVLVLCACLIMMFESVVVFLLQSFIIQWRFNGYAMALMWIGVASGLTRCLGFGLLVAAAFADRERQNAFYDQPLPPVTATIVD